MSGIEFSHKGEFTKTEKFLDAMLRLSGSSIFDKYGEMGVKALAANTPQRSGATANAWSYEVIHGDGETQIVWNNSNVNDGIAVAILIQYGHGTGTGGYVQGIDYINPAIKSVFEKFANDLWKEVLRS